MPDRLGLLERGLIFQFRPANRRGYPLHRFKLERLRLAFRHKLFDPRNRLDFLLRPGGVPEHQIALRYLFVVASNPPTPEYLGLLTEQFIPPPLIRTCCDPPIA